MNEKVTDEKVKKKSGSGGKKFLLGLMFLILCLCAGFGGAAIYQQFLGIESTPKISIKSEDDAIADVVDKVGDSVVSIVTTGKTQSNNIYDWYFGGGNGSTETAGAGTGVVISADGYVITNKHVIPDTTTSVTVIMRDGTQFENVEVVGRDPLNDIAFLKIKDVSDLKPAEFGDSANLKQGQKVVAIGNALGEYQNTVTAGIIGGIGRTVTASDGVNNSSIETLTNLLQTDAAINPGNSGGPLVTLDGKVIGINTAIAEDAEGMGFAIPTSEFKGMLDSVLATGKVERAYLGVMYVSLTKEIVDQYNLPVDNGAYINSSQGSPIIKGGPADDAGLRSGDIIVKVAGDTLDSTHTLTSAISKHKIGDTIELTILRGDQEIKVNVTLEKYES